MGVVPRKVRSASSVRLDAGESGRRRSDRSRFQRGWSARVWSLSGDLEQAACSRRRSRTASTLAVGERAR